MEGGRAGVFVEKERECLWKANWRIRPLDSAALLFIIAGMSLGQRRWRWGKPGADYLYGIHGKAKYSSKENL